MANYLDGMDGGKHNSDKTIVSFTPKRKALKIKDKDVSSFMIENLQKIYDVKHPEFIQKIDWKLLREQKLDMLYTITDLEENARHAYSSGEVELFDDYKKWADSLSGIISLIDTIQDYATKEMGLSDKEVFNLEEE